MRKKVLAVLLAAILALPLFSLSAAAEPIRSVTPPSVSAASAILTDAEHGLVLFEKDADRRLPMASTTKIMTALTALANAEADRVIRVPREAVGVEGSSVYLAEGEELTLCDLLYALLLQSANDAAAAYKDHYTRQELKALFAEKGPDTARVCAMLTKQTALLEEILESGECVSLKALSVTGRDFPALCGKDVGKTLRALLSHVLLHPEDNDRQTLLRLAAAGIFEISDVDGHEHVGEV